MNTRGLLGKTPADSLCNASNVSRRSKVAINAMEIRTILIRLLLGSSENGKVQWNSLRHFVDDGIAIPHEFQFTVESIVCGPHIFTARSRHNEWIQQNFFFSFRLALVPCRPFRIWCEMCHFPRDTKRRCDHICRHLHTLTLATANWLALSQCRLKCRIQLNVRNANVLAAASLWPNTLHCMAHEL